MLFFLLAVSFILVPQLLSAQLQKVPYFQDTLYIYPTDNLVDQAWGADGIVTNANDNYNGQNNTAQIVANSVSSAALYCDTLVDYGFSDWYLPSKNELDIMRSNWEALGGFDTTKNYWSSTEYDANNAWGVDFGSGLEYQFTKLSTQNVRCVRLVKCPWVPASISCDKQTIFKGESITLTGSQAGSWAWSTSEYTQSITVNPTVTTTYFLEVSECGGTSNATITVNVFDSIPYQVHDQDTIYVYPVRDQNSFTYDEAIQYCDTLNAFGFSDWQMPSIRQIDNIVNDRATFSYLSGGGYWSKDSSVTTNGFAWYLSDPDGTYRNETYKSDYHTAQCVRYAPCHVTPSPVNLGNDTLINPGDSLVLSVSGGTSYQWSNSYSLGFITDSVINIKPVQSIVYSVTVSTGLCEATDYITIGVNKYKIFDQDTLVVLPVKANPYTYDDAVKYCHDLVKWGYDDWELPSATQMITIVQDWSNFSYLSGTNFWTRDVASDNSSWMIEMGEGYWITESNNDQYAAAQCVRHNPCHVVPVANLGNDTAIYKNASLRLTVSSGTSYRWNDNSSDSTYLIESFNPENYSVSATSATFSVTVTNGACDATDKIVVSVRPLPKFVVGKDTMYVYPIIASDTAIWATMGLNVYASSTTNGRSNTDSILYWDETGFKAANVCQNLIIDNRSDWYLPAKDELDLIYQNRASIADLKTNTTYWSSTEVDTNNVWAQDFSNGSQINNRSKISVTSTMCVRKDICQLPTVKAGSDKIICNGDQIELLANSLYNVKWNTGETTSKLIVQPSVTTTYTVSASACAVTVTDDVVVQVNNSCVSDIDGNKYVPVNIGAQTWLKENLKTTRYNNGDVINFVGDAQSWFQYSGANCNYYDDPSYRLPLGALYNYYAVEDSRGLCPTGWHVPSAGDWDSLANFLGGSAVAGNKLKEKNSSYWVNNGGTDDVGFAALAAGYRNGSGGWFDYKDYGAMFWTSTPNTSFDAYYETLDNSNSSIAENVIDKANGNSVRCVKDITCVLPVLNAGIDKQSCDTSMIALDDATASGYDSIFWKTTGTGTFGNSRALNTVYVPSAADVIKGSVSLIMQATVNDCISGYDTLLITLAKKPTINMTIMQDSICSGKTISVTGISVANNDSIYWSVAQGAGTLSDPKVLLPSYTTSGAGINKLKLDVFGSPICPVVSDTFTIIAQSLPIPVLSNDTAICNGSSVTLAAAGGSTYLWSNSDNTASILVSPSSNTNFTVTVTDANGCSAIDSVSVTVNNLPMVEAGADQIICIGAAVTTNISATGATSYSWSNSGNTKNISVTPLSTTTYTLTAMSSAGCIASDSLVVIVNPLPTPTATSNAPVCAGQTLTLTGGPNGNTYAWSGPNGYTSTSQSPTVSAAATLAMAGTYKLVATNGGGCKDSVTTVVTINSLPTPTATSNAPVCAGQTLSLTGGPNGNTYAWSGPNSYASTSQSPTVSASATSLMAGTYKLVVTNGSGCKDSVTTVATINSLPTPSATSNAPVCAGQTLTLTGAPNGNTYAWSGPNSYTSTSQSPTVSASATSLMAGTYKLVVTNGSGCKDSVTTVVTINSLPTPTASSNAPVCAGQTLTLTGGPNGNTYAWSGPNGYTSTSQSPTVSASSTIAMAGNYQLKVFNVNGCSDSISIPVVVNALPIADAGVDQAICVGSAVTFTAAGGTGYSWNNGSLIAEISDTPTVNTTYTVTVTDASLCTASDQVSVTVNGNTADYGFTLNIPTSTVTFSDSSSGQYDNWYWDFGDALYSNSAAPVHKYSSAGAYEACLTVAHSTLLCQSRHCETVVIGSNYCNADFTFTNPSDKTVDFTNHSTGNITKVYWEFGDGSVSNESNPTYVYPAQGYYQVSLTVFDEAGGCMNKTSHVVLAGNPGADCYADFIYDVDLSGKEVAFYDMSTVSGNSIYTWDFGDGSLATGDKPVHVFSQGGYYQVCLTIVDTLNHCGDYKCTYIKVDDQPDYCFASYIYYADTNKYTIYFNNTSVGDYDYVEWDFGDGTNDYSINPVHTFAQPGYYRIHERIRNTVTNCTSDYIGVVVVNEDNTKLKAAFGFVLDQLFFKKGVFPVAFKGASFGDASEMQWDFGDGTTNSTSLSPSHDYTAEGTYDVCFTVSDPITGQSDKTCNNVDISTTGIHSKTLQENGVSIYPNPFHQNLTMSYTLQKDGMLKIALYDALGKEVDVLLNGEQASGKHTLELNIPGLPAGIYMLQITGDGIYINKKLVKE